MIKKNPVSQISWEIPPNRKKTKMVTYGMDRFVFMAQSVCSDCRIVVVVVVVVDKVVVVVVVVRDTKKLPP